MERHGGQSIDEIYAGLALTERAIGGERRCLAHLATEQGLQMDCSARGAVQATSCDDHKGDAEGRAGDGSGIARPRRVNGLYAPSSDGQAMA